MTMSTAQKVGVGALLGGVASIGTSMLLRYFADNKGTKVGESIEYSIWWEHAPLVGILGGAAATVLTYYLFGKSTEAAVACGAAALIAGVAPESDAWVTEARSEAELKKPETKPCPEGQTAQADGTCAGLHGTADVIEMRSRIAAVEATLEEFRAAA